LGRTSRIRVLRVETARGGGERKVGRNVGKKRGKKEKKGGRGGEVFEERTEKRYAHLSTSSNGRT